MILPRHNRQGVLMGASQTRLTL
ncbi:hypothetical protein B566_EDAN006588 [Ephemera danica]|nr:hypothetical protein B566_EDAN006588 [Ephemera danica]